MSVYIKVPEDNDLDPFLRQLAVAGSTQQLALRTVTGDVESNAAIHWRKGIPRMQWGKWGYGLNV